MNAVPEIPGRLVFRLGTPSTGYGYKWVLCYRLAFWQALVAQMIWNDHETRDDKSIIGGTWCTLGTVMGEIVWAFVIGWDPRVCNSNRLHVDDLRFFYTNLRYIPWIPLTWLVILLRSWTSTGYFSNSTGSSVINCRFSPIYRLGMNFLSEMDVGCWTIWGNRGCRYWFLKYLALSM